MAEEAEWEYRVISFGGILRSTKDEDMEAELNALGAEGWEVVSGLARENTFKITVLAKRPLSANVRRKRTAPPSPW